MEAEIRKLAKRKDGNDSDDEPAQKKVKKSFLQEELSKYSKGLGVHKKGRRKDEGDVLAAIASFRGQLQKATTLNIPDEGDMDLDGEEGTKELATAEDDPGMEVDDDRGFMGHALVFPKVTPTDGTRNHEMLIPYHRMTGRRLAKLIGTMRSLIRGKEMRARKRKNGRRSSLVGRVKADRGFNDF